MVDKLFDIKVGDKFCVKERIYKIIFNQNFGLTYKPNKFYTVFSIEKTDVSLRLTTSSEHPADHSCRITMIKNGEIRKYVEHFNFVKKEDYEEITKIDYFQEI